MINLVTTTQLNPDLSELVERLMALSLEGKIVGILHILNDSLADLVQSDETRVLYGQDYFYENLLGLKLRSRRSPSSSRILSARKCCMKLHEAILGIPET